VPVDPADPASLRCGIEAEFALVSARGELLDFTNLSFAAVQRVVDRLPDHGDPDLTRGDLAIKTTRWYVEGDERFAADGTFLRCVPKGVETRTPVCDGVAAATDLVLRQSGELAAAAAEDGLALTGIGLNPVTREYRPDPPFNPWELAMRARRPEYAGPEAYMLTYGPDVNVSHPGWTAERVLDIGRKLTFYAPALLPFGSSSPFAAGTRAAAYSARTLLRARTRPVARVFGPGGTPARIPAEVGRVEFKAFDAPPDVAWHGPLLALVAGLALDRTLPGRADSPDVAALCRAAVDGFDRDRDPAARVLDAAAAALGAAGEPFLAPLAAAVAERRTPAHGMIEAYERSGRIPLPPLDAATGGLPWTPTSR
jgi:Glutamate-cysteine ligase family 2(GCS2)